MASSITLLQTRDIVGDSYIVTSTVTTVAGIPPELFVMKQSGEYDHVATVFDLQNITDTTSGAGAFYRSSTVTLTFTDVMQAAAAAALHKTRLDELLGDYDAYATSFEGNDTTTFSR